MIGTTPYAHWDLDSMNMIPSIDDLPRRQIDEQLNKKFPSNASHSILEAVFAADEHVTLAMSVRLAQRMQELKNASKPTGETDTPETTAAKSGFVDAAFRDLKSFVQTELERVLHRDVVEHWDASEGHTMQVLCDATVNPPSVVAVNKMIAHVALHSGITKEVVAFHFVFDQVSMVEAIIKTHIDDYLINLAARKPHLYEVICDRTNNSDEDIANNILNADIVHDSKIADRLRKAGFEDSK